MTYAHTRKHFQFKSNRINNKNLIQIIKDNSSCFWPETILQQQLHNLIMQAVFPRSPTKFPEFSLTSSIPGLTQSVGTRSNDATYYHTVSL